MWGLHFFRNRVYLPVSKEHEETMNGASNTREQIINKAAQLMLQRGLNGFSYRDISEPLGVKNAAIHYHFPSKADLVLALIAKQEKEG